ncbi:hypothetical protein [Frondihabitans cladoniiphilus]
MSTSGAIRTMDARLSRAIRLGRRSSLHHSGVSFDAHIESTVTL